MKNQIHCLKTWPEFYHAVISGHKTFELRKADRSFKVGDVLVLQEWDPTTQRYTGEMVSKTVSYITQELPWDLEPGFVLMSLKDFS